MRLPLEWVGNSLAADDVTKWVRLPDACKKIAIGIGWPATGTPVGTLSIQVSNHGKAGVAGAAYPITIATQPTGATAKTVVLDNIETGAKFVRMVYTRGSGGTGCIFVDDSGVAGTTPSIDVKE
jgi:hypothetical protein